MITLYRKPDDPKADEIEGRFEDLILAYKTEVAEGSSTEENLPKIVDGDTTVTGDQQIEEWLTELEADLKWQRSLSGDGCFIDPKSGKVC